MNKRFAFIFLSLFLQAIVDGAPDPKANETSPDEGNESGWPRGCSRDEDCGSDQDCSKRYVCRHHTCQLVKPQQDRCDQKFACPGPCWRKVPSWSYNQATKKCERFTYGGCEGNENRFPTRVGCYERCEKGCAHGQFACKRRPGFLKQCIPLHQKCDGKRDCWDGSDENPNICGECGVGGWKCDNGQCIGEPMWCNGKRDCQDGSDERRCKSCNFNQFTCKMQPGQQILQCIPLHQKCDGKRDCRDGDDEDPNICGHCRHNEFRCKNGQCIKKWLKCNGVADCHDGSDECDCPPVPPPHPDPDHMCRCINPFHDHRPQGDPEWLCRTKGLCYVNCDLSCSDEEKSNNIGRCESKYACNKNKLGEEKGKKEEKNELKYLEKGKKDEE